MSSTPTQIAPPTDRPLFHDLEHECPGLERYGFDVVELKADGMWAEVNICDHRIGITSRTGTPTPPTSGSCRSLLDATIVAEFLRGTSWSRRKGRHGRCVAFDLIRLGDRDLRPEPLRVRRAALEGLFAGGRLPEWFGLSEQFPISEWERLWAAHVATGEWEGLVFKRSGDPFGEPWGRLKREVTVDFVCLGSNLSTSETYAGRAAASILAGLFIEGELRHVCSVAGLTDELRFDLVAHPECYVGRVFEAVGKGQFESGALRHGNFSHWRPDKRPADCTWEAGALRDEPEHEQLQLPLAV